MSRQYDIHLYVEFEDIDVLKVDKPKWTGLSGMTFSNRFHFIPKFTFGQLPNLFGINNDQIRFPQGVSVSGFVQCSRLLDIMLQVVFDGQHPLRHYTT